MTIANSFAAKLFGAFAVVAVALAAFAPAAQAQTEEELQQQINALLEQIAALEAQLGEDGGSTGSGMSCDYTFTMPLSMGDQNAEVMKLQEFLNMDPETRVAATGVGSAGQETNYFGSLTKAAVEKFQMKYRDDVLTPLGLVNATGYWGNSSIQKANELCSDMGTMPGDDEEDGDEPADDDEDELSGGAGSIDDADFMSEYNNEEVGEDEEDVIVAGLEIEADGSDIELRAVTLDFDYMTLQQDADDDLDEYASEVSIWFEGEEVARMDADEFEDDDDFERTISLDDGAIIDEGETGELVVALSGVSNLDSNNEGQGWNVAFESVRFRDAQGAVITDSSTGDINDSNNDTTTDSGEREFSFESFASAENVELSITSGDDEINDSRIIDVDDSDDTDNVELFSFELELDGDSDVMIDSLPINATSTGSGDVSDIVSAMMLVVDGEEVGSESVSGTGQALEVVFEDLDWELEAGETYEVVVTADINEINEVNTGGFEEGDTIALAFGETETDDADFDAEDESGESLADGDVKGSASSDAHLFYDAGLALFASDMSTDIKDTNGDTAGGEEGTYVIEFEVTAFDDDIYVPTGATTATSSFTVDKGVAFTMEDGDGDSTGAGTTTTAVASTANKSGSYFVVEQGDTETFTLTINYDPASSGFFRAQLDAVNYKVGEADDADVHLPANPEEDFETDYENLDA